MNFILKFSLSLFGIWLLGITQSLQAQCESCDSVPNYTPEFCYTTGLIPGKCAVFALDANVFYYQPQVGKPKKMLNLPDPLKADSAYFNDLIANKAFKIKALDLLFLIEALKAWKIKEVELLVEAASTSKWTGDQLTGFEYEVRDNSVLGIHTIKQGKGSLPKVRKEVTVHYRGYLENGTIFDESYKRGAPFSFPLGFGRVIKGWDEGIALLPIGTRAILKIPPEIGYGSRSAGSIPPNSTLYFDVVVLE